MVGTAMCGEGGGGGVGPVSGGEDTTAAVQKRLFEHAAFDPKLSERPAGGGATSAESASAFDCDGSGSGTVVCDRDAMPP
jgi:hypothetical protein